MFLLFHISCYPYHADFRFEASHVQSTTTISLLMWFFFTLFDAARRRMKMDDDEVLIEFFLCFWFSIDLECVHKNLCNCSPVSQTTHRKISIILKCWADDLSQAIRNV